MPFQEFKNSLEKKLNTKTKFELLEFHYQPYHFGSGVLAYKINGINYRFSFNGKDNLLSIEQSKSHEKYSDSNWTIVFEQRGLDVNNFIDVLFP